MKYLVDIDGVLANGLNNHLNFAGAEPNKNWIAQVNKLAEDNTIVIYSSRLEQDRPVTTDWLEKHGVKYNELILGKPTADYYIDDKAIDFIPQLDADLDRFKLAICLSGGMDSYIAYFWAIEELGYKPEDIVCLNFNIGHPYYGKEADALEKLDIPYRTIDVGLIKDEYGNTPDEVNYIIPGRNMIFASIAASFGERVWIMGMKFENHHQMYDKNENFFRLSSLALSQAVGSPTVVESPFSNLTKTDIIEWALKHKLPHLHDTTSCYHPTELRCGYCSLCFKRFIAMQVCGANEDFSTDPRTSSEAKRLVAAYKDALDKQDFSHYQEDRIHETLKIMGEE